MSHRQLRHRETKPWLKVSSKRLEKGIGDERIDLANLDCYPHTTTTPNLSTNEGAKAMTNVFLKLATVSMTLDL